MNLRKAMFWRQLPKGTEAERVSRLVLDSIRGRHEPRSTPTRAPAAPMEKVVPLTHSSNLVEFGDPRSPDEQPQPPKPTTRMTGLMNTPELEAFFKINQFGFGRYHGSRYRTLEAMEHGADAIVAQFQHVLCELMERRYAKSDKLRLSKQDVAALSVTMAERLDLALDQTAREIEVLREQIAQAGQRRGWILDALNRYRLGFDRGVREALDYELHNS